MKNVVGSNPTERDSVLVRSYLQWNNFTNLNSNPKLTSCGLKKGEGRFEDKKKYQLTVFDSSVIIIIDGTKKDRVTEVEKKVDS